MTQTGTSNVEQIIAKLENDACDALHRVMGMLETIAQEPLTETQRRYLRTCRSSMDQLLLSVENIAAFVDPASLGPVSQGHTGDAAQSSCFNLREVIADLADVMEGRATNKGLAFFCEISADVQDRLTGDPGRLRAILIRLLDNAIRFTERGQIRLIVTQLPPSCSGPSVQFEVCDTGPGIPQDVVARLSDPVPEHCAWEGLGLLFVAKMVAKMRGQVMFGREVGGGSRVTLSIPFPSVSSGSANREEEGEEEERTLSILVAEDSDDSYYVMETFLSQHNHTLTRARTGLRAVELFKAGMFDLVFMDVHMPVMDGFAATHAIRAWETGCTRARVPIVVLSSDSRDKQIQRGAKVGCSAYLTKPVSDASILNVLKRYGSARATPVES